MSNTEKDDNRSKTGDHYEFHIHGGEPLISTGDKAVNIAAKYNDQALIELHGDLLQLLNSVKQYLPDNHEMVVALSSATQEKHDKDTLLQKTGTVLKLAESVVKTGTKAAGLLAMIYKAYQTFQ